MSNSYPFGRLGRKVVTWARRLGRMPRKIPRIPAFLRSVPKRVDSFPEDAAEFWRDTKPFPIVRQLDAMDCGPTCLQMIMRYWGRVYSLPFLRDRCFLTREGVSLLGISKAAEALGMRTLAAKLSFDDMVREAPTPFIAHWQQRHFVVVYHVTSERVYVADPAHGKISYSKREFLKNHVLVHASL